MYLPSLDRLNSFVNPELSDMEWEIQDVLKHIEREQSDGTQKIYLKVQYRDGDKAILPMDTVQLHDPKVVARYAISHNLASRPGWEWVSHYLDINPVRQAFLSIFKTSIEDGKKYKFGV